MLVERSLSAYTPSAMQSACFANEILRWLAGLTPIVTAAIATYIAYQQWRTNRDKVRLESFDRRIAVHKAIEEYLMQIYREGTVTFKQVLKLRTEVSYAVYLFDKEVEDYIDELQRKGIRLEEITGKPEHATEMKELLRWFKDQLEGMNTKVSRHLRIKI